MKNAMTFGAQAENYAAARPTYPPELFDWIAAQASGTDLVWDVGTGSGQAARSLAGHFDRVHATDADPAQIEQAEPHPKITFAAGLAHQSNLPDSSVDAVTVATALHWFDWKAFWAEIARVARPGGIFCAWTYHRAEVDDEIREYLLEPVLALIDPYWAEGNRLSWRGYDAAELGMPFEVIPHPEMACHLAWTAAQIAGFMKSWSAHKKARLDGLEDDLNTIEARALAALGSDLRAYTLPLNMIAARVG